MTEPRDLTLQTDFGKFNARIGVLAFQDGKILMQKHVKNNYYFTPGGRIAFGDDTLTTAKRELEEELHLQLDSFELAAFIENFFSYDNEDYHEMAIYYRTELPEGFVPPTEEVSGKPICFEWLPIQSLENFDIRPVVIKENIDALTQGFQHFINKA